MKNLLNSPDAIISSNPIKTRKTWVKPNDTLIPINDTLHSGKTLRPTERTVGGEISGPS